VVAIAQDVQGAAVARPWMEQAGASYPCLLDQKNFIGKAYNLKYVPVGILLDESGCLVRSVASVNIDDAAFRAEVEAWARTGLVPEGWQHGAAQEAVAPLTQQEEEADRMLVQAVALLEAGDKGAAVEALRRGYRADPDNWLIRKQLWAVENPEAFYTGPVDYAWQKQRIEKEDQGA
jgi:hypothetical protein